MKVECKRLSEVERDEVMELMNHPLLKKHMPLMEQTFGDSECDAFLAAKEQIWQEHGYGPGAFFIDDRFAGWGGLQPEHGEADIALVLHPDFWGSGRTIYQMIIIQAFGKLQLTSVTALLPPSRTRVKGLLSLGFVEERTVSIDGEQFKRYRLNNTEHS